jgi:hypothetical protein
MDTTLVRPDAEAPAPVALVDAAVRDPFDLPWQTGFEDGFVDYEQTGGECFASPTSSYELVNSPVHSGTVATAFQAGADMTEDGFMAHCVRYDVPAAAFYGAWFFAPTEVTSAAVWAVMHFDGNGASEQHNLWDVRVAPNTNGRLQFSAFDYLEMETLEPNVNVEVPFGQWFHLEVYWERAADASGTFELYVDGTPIISATGRVTDDAETSEWYVGNFAAWTVPNPNTIYVDDVTVASTRQGGS